MKKFSNATLAAVSHPRAMARIVLAFVASILVVLLGLIGTGSGPNGTLAFAQEESPSPTPTGPTGPQIKLLNPNPSYDPLADPSCQPPACTPSDDPPEISDRYDGHDRAFHVVAWTDKAPAGAIVEAYWTPTDENEMTVGQLTQVPGAPDTWELYWDIPSDWAEGGGEFTVRLFAPTGGGFEQVAEHKVPARLQHEGNYGDPDDAPAEETVEITWPAQNGEIGFYKPKGGFWRGVVDGVASGSRRECAPDPVTGAERCQVVGGTNRVYVFYSTAPPGAEPDYQGCGFTNTTPNSVRAQDDRAITWRHTCTLAGKTLPSDVTAMAAVASEVDQPGQQGLLTQDSADAHRVRPYAQDVRRMKVSIAGVPPTPTAAWPTGQRRTAGSDCLEFDATVVDHLDRPVQGANVDIHIQGPNDQVGFGDEAAAAHGSSAEKAPDAGVHPKEGQWDCDAPGDRYQDNQQGDHNIPGGDDIKHVESTLGSGLDGPTGIGAGQFRFHIFSTDPGRTDITAWVDDMPIPNEGATREADDDDPVAAEPKGSLTAQWFPAEMTASISPKADSATVGTCNRYVLRLRAGNAVVDGINVDLHASGPNNDLDFCDPGDGTTRRAPDKPEGDTAHAPEDQGESTHASSSPDAPQVQHTEGETDGAGNFIFGITSPVTGASQITAWVDGETGQDNDVQNSGEVTTTASKSWAGSAQDAEVRFVNPSGYGGSGDNISNKRDANEQFHLVARVDLPDVVEGVEFFASSDGTSFIDLGDGTRVGTTDTWELYTALPDGEYTLRAQIINTDKREDREVVVDSTMEAAELTRPADASGAPFSEGATVVEGVASADAEGVEFYYTKTDARESREEAQWTLCGETELPTGDAPQNFEGSCELQGTDAALDVTGIAALTWTCPDPVVGCDLGRTYQTGDAHRVYGFESNPSVSIEPAEATGATDVCKRFELTVTDAVGRAIPNANVDVHLTGPGDAAEFCDVNGGSPRQAPTAGGHSATTDGDAAEHQQEGADTLHTEGEADEGGKFVFGVTSSARGESQIMGWADQNDNDALDSDEKSDTSVMHWGSGGGGSRCTISGDSGNNVIRGTAGDDVICAGGGRDTIRGLGGNDLIYGGAGHDDIRGNAGNDRLIGGRGIDVLRGGLGNDLARGKGQNDTIRGYNGRDRLAGGGGDDVIAGGGQADFLRGNTGNDTLSGGRGRDDCRGGRGRDSVSSCER